MDKPNDLSALRSATVLGMFAVIGLGLVTMIYQGTQAKIAANKRAILSSTLHELVPDERFDNDIVTDYIILQDDKPSNIDVPFKVYRARKNGIPVAGVIEVVAPDGYNGAISLLIGVNMDGTLTGVRVVSHRETPGLGDDIEVNRSDWVLQFTGLSRENTNQEKWKVKRDGGVFDQFTGATITPRAVVKAVYRSLIFFSTNKNSLF